MKRQTDSKRYLQNTCNKDIYSENVNNSQNSIIRTQNPQLKMGKITSPKKI
jgi:hypothetical protein